MIIGNERIDLKTTLIDSAQCFAWSEVEGNYVSVLCGQPVLLRETVNGVQAQTDLSAEYLRRYLDLDRDYEKVFAPFSDVVQIMNAYRAHEGLRVLNQDPWETLVQFILSANNNVVRIRKLVNALRIKLGERIVYGGIELNGFPSPDVLAACSEHSLRELGMGYRAPYLIGSAMAVRDGFPLDTLSDMPYEAAEKLLCSLPGVGKKVANCVLLFGCGHVSAFPVDVWVKRLLKVWFGMPEDDPAKLKTAAEERFGKDAGIIQQYLFHAARTGTVELK